MPVETLNRPLQGDLPSSAKEFAAEPTPVFGTSSATTCTIQGCSGSRPEEGFPILVPSPKPGGPGR